jgi:hypothetical protein
LSGRRRRFSAAASAARPSPPLSGRRRRYPVAAATPDILAAFRKLSSEG